MDDTRRSWRVWVLNRLREIRGGKLPGTMHAFALECVGRVYAEHLRSRSFHLACRRTGLKQELFEVRPFLLRPDLPRAYNQGADRAVRQWLTTRTRRSGNTFCAIGARAC